ncbi:MAG: ABC transporter ATP-binding protein [Deltaproteobacteria bacterium]|nr:ABC transporter ATP-binding protein [Deltaproteobacteria bacterium]
MNAVKADNLTKRYRVYLRPFDRLKEALIRRPFHEKVEALSHVSFEVPPGETVGIIGENGAGKSTLLKILAGTVRPTQGNVTKQGRTAALLELGSGFHPEFSGRQNIYLNAALLGLSDREIKDREQEIIEFSELKGVIDRPVRTYSSGMYVRLGFSIATSVNPDVLIIDEALSVGDQRFQQKCIERMIGFRNANKTIILCSHSMYLIRELCANTLWLRDGRLCSEGKTPEVISQYLAYLETDAHGKSAGRDCSDRPYHSEITIESVSILDENRRPLCDIDQFQNVIIQIKTQRNGHPLKGHLAVSIGQSEDQPIFETTTKICGMEPIEFLGDRITELFIPSIPIQGGKYRVRAKVGDEFALRSIDEMRSEPFLIKSNRPEIGMLWMEHHWRLTEAP